MREIYYNGVIYTGTGRDAEAMAVEDGRIAGVGNLNDLETCSDAVYHNLDGHFVVPGFNDSHMHLVNFGYSLQAADLGRHTSSLAEVQEELRRFHRANPDPVSYTHLIAAQDAQHVGDVVAVHADQVVVFAIVLLFQAHGTFPGGGDTQRM